MPSRPIVVAAVVTAVLVCAAVRRHRSVRRALLKERAARRLTEASHYRDMQAFTIRLHHAVRDRAVLEAADLVLDSALAAHHHNPEGGPV